MALYEPDHYRVLGVPINADGRRLKEAYHRLSRVYHPDLRGGSRAATDRFQLISAAYGTLSDAAEREIYDRKLILLDPLRMVDDPRAERALDRIDGIVGRLRRRPKALPNQSRGRDLRVRADVPFAIAALGGAWSVTVDYETTCTTCEGVGTSEPERNPGCHICMGEGSLKVGLRRKRQRCGFCEGRGEVLLAPCQSCAGSGRVQDRREVPLQVPPRLRDGAILRVRGGGEPASGEPASGEPASGEPASGEPAHARAQAGQAARTPRPGRSGRTGDVIVETHITADPLLESRKDDVICQLPLTWTEAINGCVRTVPSLSGSQRLRIPAGSWSGRELKVSGQGLLRRDGSRGDLRYVMMLDMPHGLTTAESEAVRALEQAIGPDRFKRRAQFEAQLRVATADEPAKTTPSTQTSEAPESP